MIIIGISGALGLDNNTNEGQSHGASACLIVEGKLVGAQSYERFSRIKYDGNFPHTVIDKLLKNNNLSFENVDIVAYGSNVFSSPRWPLEKIKIKKTIKSFFSNAEIIIIDHHCAHSASAFYSSPFEESSVLSLDNGGDIISLNDVMYLNYGSFNFFSRNPFTLKRYSSFYSDLVLFDCELKKDNYKKLSIGHFYNEVSSQILFKLMDLNPRVDRCLVDSFNFYQSAPGKVMGLAAYGKPISLQQNIFKLSQPSPYEMPEIFCETDFLNPSFSYELHKYKPEDLALWLQTVFENTILNYLDKIPKPFKHETLCFGGGCALNINLNSKILTEGLFKDVHICPAPNDDGISLGAAFLVSAEKNISLKIPSNPACIGFEYSNLNTNSYGKCSIKEITKETESEFLNKHTELLYKRFDYETLYDVVSTALVENKIVAWFQGKSEFGPRALGNRSILANPTINNKKLLNEKVKFREYWRPYAAIILEECLEEWFECPKKHSHYMLFNTTVKNDKKEFIPGVVHADDTCRIQTVTIDTNEKMVKLLNFFYKKTNIPLLLNTSFNTKPKEPIVETPEDAIKSFVYSNIDVLVINDTIWTKQSFSKKDTLNDETHIGNNQQINTNKSSRG